jgi:TM2 domain-containing membrane protein YozV
MFCSKCGSSNSDAAGFCAKCGAALAGAATTGGSTAPPAADPGTMRTSASASTGQRVSGKNPTVALVLSIFLGALGGGQFYNGDWKKGLVMAGASILLGVATGGLVSFGVWIWSMVDAWQVAGGKWTTW